MRKIIITAFFFTSLLTYSGERIDSLRKIVNNAGTDSLKVMTWFNLAHHYYGEPAKALEVASEMALFCDKIKSKKDKALCLRKIGVIYHQMNFFDKSLEYTFQSAKLFDELNDKDGVANCYNNIANAYKSKGELTSDDMLFDRAIEFHQKCISLRKEINDTDNVKNSYNNLALVYMAKKDYDKAIDYLTIPYEFFKRLKTDVNGIDMTTSNLGEAWLGKARAERKPEYYRKALSYYTDRLNNYTGNKPAINKATALEKAGDIYAETGQTERGLEFLIRAYSMYAALHNQVGLSSCALSLSRIYRKKGENKLAIDYLNYHLESKDSLLNQRNKSNAERLQAVFQSSQKDKEIEKLNNEKKLKDAELTRQRTIIFSSVGGLLLILLLGFVLLSRYNLKKKANEQLGEAYSKIELKNRQITDSINYARRIQNAILPPVEIMKKRLKHFFIFYQPKDIVSGDFYWFTHVKEKTFFVVADCTGHGVPGALMSMIGNTLLNEIINQKNIHDPGKILEHLNHGVSLALRQQGNDRLSQDDGMDITVVSLSENSPAQLNYATANHTILVKSAMGIRELKGDIYSIGGNFDSADKNFHTHTATLEKGDFVILSTDGYSDQFGGNDSRKFLISRFEKLVLETDLYKEGAEEIFKNEFETWRGNTKQTDDILVAGFAIS